MVSTVGLILSDLRFDSLKSYPTLLETMDVSALGAVLKDMGCEGQERIERERLSAKIVTRYFLDMRYQRQHSEISLEVDPDDLSVARLAEMFDDEHKRLFGFAMDGHRHEIINLRCSVSGSLGDPQDILNRFAPAFPETPKPAVGNVRLYDEVTRAYVDADVYLRTDLSPAQSLPGPAIVMSADSTVYVPADSDAVVDAFGNILIDIGTRRPAV